MKITVKDDKSLSIVRNIVSKIDIDKILSSYNIEYNNEYFINDLNDFWLLLDFIDATSKKLDMTKHLQITSNPIVFRTIKVCMLFDINEKVNEIEECCLNNDNDDYIQTECLKIIHHCLKQEYHAFVMVDPGSNEWIQLNITQMIMYEFGSMQYVSLLRNFLKLICTRSEFVNIPWINPLLLHVNLLMKYCLEQAANKTNKSENYQNLEYKYLDDGGKITVEYCIEEDKICGFLLSYSYSFSVSYDTIIR